MDRKRAEQGVKTGCEPQPPARMSLNLKGILVRPTRFELVTSCSGGKRLSRVIYNLGRGNGRSVDRNPRLPQKSKGSIWRWTGRTLHDGRALLVLTRSGGEL